MPKIKYRDLASALRQDLGQDVANIDDVSLVQAWITDNPQYKNDVIFDGQVGRIAKRTGNLLEDLKTAEPLPRTAVAPQRGRSGFEAPMSTPFTGGFVGGEMAAPQRPAEDIEFLPTTFSNTLEGQRILDFTKGKKDVESIRDYFTSVAQEGAVGSESKLAKTAALRNALDVNLRFAEEQYNDLYPDAPLSWSDFMVKSSDPQLQQDREILGQELTSLFGKMKYYEAMGDEQSYNQAKQSADEIANQYDSLFGEFEQVLQVASPLLEQVNQYGQELNQLNEEANKEAQDIEETSFFGKAALSLSRFGAGLGYVAADLFSTLGATGIGDKMKSGLMDSQLSTKDPRMAAFKAPYDSKKGGFTGGVGNAVGFIFEQGLNMIPAIAAFSTPYGRAAQTALATIGTTATTYDEYANEIDRAAIETGAKIDPQTRAALAGMASLKTGLIENVIPINKFVKLGMAKSFADDAVRALASGKSLEVAMRGAYQASKAFAAAQGVEISEEIIDQLAQETINESVRSQMAGLEQSEQFAARPAEFSDYKDIVVNTAIAVAPLAGVGFISNGARFKEDLYHHVGRKGDLDAVMDLFEENKDKFKGESYKKNTDRLKKVASVYESIPQEFDDINARKVADNMLEIDRLDGQINNRTSSSQREAAEKKIANLQGEIDQIYREEQEKVAPTTPQAVTEEVPAELEAQMPESDQNVLNVVSERIEPILNPLTQRMTNAEEIDMAEIEAVAEQMIDEQARILESENLSEEEKQSISQLIELQIDNILSYEFATITTTEQAGEKTKTAGLVATPREGRPLPESVVSRDRFDGAGVRVGGKGAGRIIVKRIPGFGGRSVYGVSFGNRKGVTPVEDLEFDNLEFVAPEVLGDGSLNVRVRDSKSGLEFTITDPELSMDLAIAAQLKEAGRKEFPQPAFLEAVREVTQGQPTQATTFPNLGRTGTTPAAVGVEPQTEQDVRQETNAPQEGRGQGEDAAPVPQEEGRQEGQVTPLDVAQEGETPPATKRVRKTEQQKADEGKAALDKLKETIRTLRAKPGGGANIDLTFGVVPISKASPKPKAVFHAGTLDGKGNIYVSPIREQANEYSSMSGAPVLEFEVNEDAMAPESEVRDLIGSLDLKLPEGYNLDELFLYEALDTRVKSSLSQGDIDKLYTALKDKGYEGIAFRDEDIRGVKKEGIDNFIVFDKSSLSEQQAQPEAQGEVRKRVEEDQEGAPAISENEFDRISKKLNKAFKGNVKIVDAETFQKEAEKTTGERIDLKSKDGTVYGAVLPNGVMFIDKGKLSANTLLHEHTHLFNQVVMSANPKLWSAIKDAVKQTEEWGKVKNNKSYSNLTTDDQIADEVFSRIVGNAAENGWQKYTDKPIYKKIKDLVQKFYNTILEAFGANVYEGMSAGALADLTLNELLGGISTTPYQIDVKTNDLMSRLFKGTKYFNQVRFSLDPNSRDKFKKALGERDGRAIYDIFGNVQDAQKVIQFAKEKFPIKGSLSEMAGRVYRNDEFEIANFGSTVIYGEYQKYINEELEDIVNESKLDPKDLLREVGYELFNPKNLTEARESFLHFYEKGRNICTLNIGSDRFQKSFVTFIVKDDAAITPMADKLTQDNLTKDWKDYLEKNGRKNADGTYNLKGLERDSLDPYSTSVVSLQINKSNGDVKEISRYNHQIGSPDNIFSRDFNKIIEGLEDAMFKKFGVNKNAKQSKNRMPYGVIQDANGRFFNYIYEENGVYYGDGFYLEGGVATLLDKNSQRMVDGFVINANGKVENVTRDQPFLYGDVLKVNYIKGNEISLTTRNGDFVFEVKNGAVVKLIDFPKEWRERELGLITDYRYDSEGNIVIEKIDSHRDFQKYINMLWADDIVGFNGSAIFDRSKIQSLGELRYIRGNAYFRGSQVKSLGKLMYIGGSASFGGSQIESLGELRYIEMSTDFGNTQIKSVGKLRYIGTSVDFGYSQIQSLGELRYIGTPEFRRSQIQSLGKLKYIRGNLDSSEVQSLGELRFVGGNAYFGAIQTKSLGELRYIGRHVGFESNNQVQSLGKLSYIGIKYYPSDISYIPETLEQQLSSISRSSTNELGDEYRNEFNKEEKKYIDISEKVKALINESSSSSKIEKTILEIDEIGDTQPEAKPEKTISDQRKEFRETAKKYFDGLKKMGIAFDPERNSKEDIAFLKALAKYIKLELDAGMVTFKGFMEKTANLVEGFGEKAIVAAAKEAWAKEVVKAYPKVYSKLQKAKKVLLDKELQDARATLQGNLTKLLSDQKIFKQISSLTTERKLDKSSSDILIGIREEIKALGGVKKLSDEQLLSYNEIAKQTYKDGRINQGQLIESLAAQKAADEKAAKSAITNQNERSVVEFKDANEAREFLSQNNGNNSNQVSINNGEIIVDSVEEFDVLSSMFDKRTTFGGTTTAPNPNNVKRGKGSFYRTTVGGGLIYLLDKLKGKTPSQETIDFFNKLQDEVKAGTFRKKRLNAELNDTRKSFIGFLFKNRLAYTRYMLSAPMINGKRLIVKDENGKEIKNLNVNNILFFYQLMKDPHFLKKDGKGERKIGLSEQSMRDIVDFVNLKENNDARELMNNDQRLIKMAAQNAANVMEANNISSELLNPRTLNLSEYKNDDFIGEILNRIYNNSVPSEIEYFPSSVESEMNNQVPNVDALLDEGLGVNAVSAMSRFMIERVSGGKVKVKSYDAQLSEYFDSMSNTAAKLPILKRFQAVFNKENSDLISSYFGKNTTDELRENIGRYITSRPQDTLLAKKLSEGTLGKWLNLGLGLQMFFNFGSAFSQLASFPGPILSYGITNYLDGLSILISGKEDLRDAFTSLKSGYLLQERLGSRLDAAAIVKSIPSDERGFSAYVNQFNKSLISFGAALSAYFDAASIMLSLPIYVREYSNAIRTMTDQEAKDYAEEKTMDLAESFLQTKNEEMMSSAESRYRTTLYSFATIVPQLHRQAIMAVKRIQRGEGDLTQNMNVFIWSAIGSSVAFRLLRPLFESIFEGDDEDEELKKLRGDKRVRRVALDLAVDATKSFGLYGAVGSVILKTGYQLVEAEEDASKVRMALDIVPEVVESVPSVSIKLRNISDAIRSYYDDENLKGTTQGIQALTGLPTERSRMLAVQMSDGFLSDNFTMMERVARLSGFISENKSREKLFKKAISTDPLLREKLSPSEIQKFESKQKSEYKSATSIIARQYSDATTESERDAAIARLISLQAGATKYDKADELVRQIQDDFDKKVYENLLPKEFLEIKRMPSTKRVNFVANEFNAIKNEQEAMDYLETLSTFDIISENEKSEIVDILLKSNKKK